MAKTRSLQSTLARPGVEGPRPRAASRLGISHKHPNRMPWAICGLEERPTATARASKFDAMCRLESIHNHGTENAYETE